jgi:hypothetical protein
LHVTIANTSKGGAFGEILPQQSIAVFVGTALVGCSRVSKIDGRTGVSFNQLVQRELRPIIVGDGVTRDVFELLFGLRVYRICTTNGLRCNQIPTHFVNVRHDSELALASQYRITLPVTNCVYRWSLVNRAFIGLVATWYAFGAVFPAALATSSEVLLEWWIAIEVSIDGTNRRDPTPLHNLVWRPVFFEMGDDGFFQYWVDVYQTIHHPSVRSAVSGTPLCLMHPIATTTISSHLTTDGAGVNFQYSGYRTV